MDFKKIKRLSEELLFSILLGISVFLSAQAIYPHFGVSLFCGIFIFYTVFTFFLCLTKIHFLIARLEFFNFALGMIILFIASICNNSPDYLILGISGLILLIVAFAELSMLDKWLIKWIDIHYSESDYSVFNDD